GNYDFDNSEFVSGPGFQGPPPAGVTNQAVIDDDYNAIRHSLWLVTDGAYKQSVEQLARKRAFVQNKIREEQIPDFSKESAVMAVGPKLPPDAAKTRGEKQGREQAPHFQKL